MDFQSLSTNAIQEHDDCGANKSTMAAICTATH